MSNQSQWKTSTGFILASAGSAIGLGAMWKFPYMAGIYGGGAFLFLFLIFTIFVGLNIIGWNGNLAVFILFGFYSVIGGWIVIYIGNVFLQLLSVEHTSLTQIKF